MNRLGFCSLGHVGRPVSANLVKVGDQVIGFDPESAALDAAGPEFSATVTPIRKQSEAAS